MKIFTDDLIEKIQAFHNNTNMYHIVNSEFFRKLLLNMDNVVARVHPKKRKGKIERLMSKENFLQTYHELLVGYLFKGFGFSVEYEPKLNTLTPDWRIKKDEQSIIVEVFTMNIDEPSNIIDNFMNCLKKSLKQIPIGVTIHANLSRLNYKELTPSVKEKIITDLKSWLIKRPEKGTVFTIFLFKDIKGIKDIYISFEIINYDKTYNVKIKKGYSKGPLPYRLTRLYEEKYSKYSKLIIKENTPFIIVGITYYFPELGFPEFDVINDDVILENMGSFNKYEHEEVSSYIFIKNYLDNLIIEIIQNKNALHKLPVEIFPQFNWNENEIYGKMDLPLV